MCSPQLSLTLHDADATASFAASLAPRLHAGDVILLSGDVGAGKTHFARAIIQNRLAAPEDVPSPTFTLVQTYETTGAEIWHCDLYRIGSTFEIEELGLIDAFETAICLVEWPDRLGPLRPQGALQLTFRSTSDDNARQVTGCWQDPRWAAKLAGLHRSE